MACQTLSCFSGLFVQTQSLLLRLDLKNYNYNFDPNSEVLPPKPDVVNRKYGDEEEDVEDAVYTAGIKDVFEVFQVGSKTYMVQREIGSLPVFEFDPKKWRMELVGDKPWRTSLWYGLETIENKIYIFTQFSPTAKSGFEVLDPSSNDRTWKKLPLPHNLLSGRVSHYFVVDHKLYFVISHSDFCSDYAVGIIFFDTRKESWDVEDNMFKYKYKFYPDGNGNYIKRVPYSMIHTDGKMVLPDVIISFKANAEASGYSSECYKWDLHGFLYSNDGCLLATQNLGKVFPKQQYASSNLLIVMEDPGKFCAVTCGDNFGVPYEDDDASNVIAVSICHVKKLHKAYAIQAEAPNMLPASPNAEVEKEEEFLSLEIEKQYFFSVQHLGPYASYICGAFLA